MTPPLAFSVDAGDAGVYFEAVAWLTAATAVILLAAAWMYLRYTGVGAAERRQLATLIPQLFRASPVTVTLKRVDGAAARRSDLRRVLTREYRTATEAGEQTVRGAFREFRAELRAVGPDVPVLASRAFIEGVLILAFGSILFASAAWWENAFDWPGYHAAITDTASAILAGLETGAGAFPVPDTLFVMALTAALVAWSVMLEYWYAVGTGLILAAIAFAAIDRWTTEDLDVTLYPDRREFLTALAVSPFYVWASGVLYAGVVGYVYGPQWGTIAGFGVATATAVTILSVAVWDLCSRVTRRQQYPGEDTVAVATYIILRRGLMTAILASLPLLLYIAGTAVSTGQASSVATVLRNAPLPTKIGVGIGVLGVLVFALYTSGSIAAFRSGVGRLRRSVALRGWLFARGIPASGMILAFSVTWAFVGTQPIGDVTIVSALLGYWPPLAAALVVGVFVRGWTLIWMRVRYRFMGFWQDRDAYDRYVSVACYPELEDTDGDAIYAARVLGIDLGHRDVDALIRDIETVATARFQGESVPATMSEYYWDAASRGTVDLDDVQRELRGDVVTAVDATFAENGGAIDEATVEEQLAQEYPAQAIEATLRKLYEDGDVSYRDGRYIHHGHDRSGLFSRIIPGV